MGSGAYFSNLAICLRKITHATLFFLSFCNKRTLKLLLKKLQYKMRALGPKIATVKKVYCLEERHLAICWRKRIED